MSWKKVKLGTVCKIQGGFAFKSQDYKEVGAPLIRISNITDSGVQLVESTVYLNEEYLSKYKDFVIAKGDILVALSGATTGKYSIYNLEIPSLLNQRVGRIVVNESLLDEKYIFFYLSQIRSTILGGAYGAAIPNISPKDIANFEIPLPPLEEQKRIAQVLDKADRLRQKDRQLLAHYDQLLQSVFLDMFGDPVKNERGWEITHLETVATISSGVTKGRNLFGKDTIELPYMRVANVQDGHLNLSEIKSIEVKVDEVDKFLLKFGDVLLTEGGDPDKLGRGTVWRNEIPNCIHQNHIFKVRPNLSILNSTYLSAHLGSSYGKRYFLKSSKQTTGIASINSTQLKKFPVQIPPLDIQEKYAAIVEKIDAQKAIAAKSIETSETLFQSLLQKAFKGELALKEEEPVAKPKFVISSIL